MLLARKEIRRARLRFGLLAGAVGLLVFLILFQQALLGSLVTSFIGALREQSATVLVYGKDARKNVAGSVITPPQYEQIKSVPGVGAAAPLGEATFTVLAAGSEVDASVFGFQPGGPGEPTRLVAGRLPSALGEAVASKEDADQGFALGDTVTLPGGTPTLTIVGQTDRSRYSVSPTLWVTFESYTALRKAANPDAKGVLPSLVALTPADGTSPGELAAAVDATVPGVEALTRADAAAKSPGVASVSQSFALIINLVRLVVALVIGFFFVILTVQKLPSLTLVRAIGAPTSYLVKGLAVQIAVVLGFGLVFGVLLTAGAIAGTSAGLPISLTTSELVTNVVLVIVLGLIGSIVSLVRVVRIDPVGAVQRPSLGGLE